MMERYKQYDHLSVDTALDRAWSDADMSPQRIRALQLRVRAVHPALARALERKYAVRHGLPDPAVPEIFSEG